MKLDLSAVHQPTCRLACVATALIVTACSSIDMPDPLIVNTEAGQVRGTAQTSASGSAETFLSIPFAAPPVGPLRWKPPVRPIAWQGVRDATAMPPLCPQGNAESVKGNEDCLYLNVFRPSGTHASSRLPVMVYAYGGGNVGGGAANFDGKRMAGDNGIIVVVPNYRLGALGFLNHPALAPLEHGGNFGVMDTMAALQWVQRNIAAFGGDPKRVTLASQSSGSTNTCRLLVDPKSTGLFHAATLMSEDCVHDVDTPQEAGVRAANLARAVGCFDTTDVAACLRSKTPAELVAAGGKGPQGSGWNPTATTPAAKLIAAGQWQRVPILMGSTRQEGRSSGVPFARFKAADYENWIRRLVGPTRAAEVLTAYPVAKYSGAFAIPYIVGDVVTDSGMRGLGGCPNIALAKAFSTQIPTYYYRFEDPNPPAPTAPAGYEYLASHGFETQYMWGPNPTTPPLTEGQTFLSNEMIRYWGAFVRNHNPAVAGQQNWPRLTESGKLLALRPGKHSAESSIMQLEKDGQCALWGTLPVIMDRGEI